MRNRIVGPGKDHAACLLTSAQKPALSDNAPDFNFQGLDGKTTPLAQEFAGKGLAVLASIPTVPPVSAPTNSAGVNTTTVTTR